MGYQMLTRSGRSFWECTSVMQNAIRKGDYDIAGNAMWELAEKYESYLRKRLLVISAEDCYGIITKEILALTKSGGLENLEKALTLMCQCKKNRDADYVVCNLMYDCEKIVAPKDELATHLAGAIECMDVVKSGALLNALFKENRKFMWEVLMDLAKKNKDFLTDEIDALHESNEIMTKPTEENIFAAKAMVLLMTQKDGVERHLGLEGADPHKTLDPSSIQIIKPIEECPKVQGNYPDWAYNWHTYRGKYYLKRDTIHAIANDQALLTPLELNLFDECSWSKDHNHCLKRWNPNNVRLPYDDGKIKPEEKYPGRYEVVALSEQISMF